MIKAIRSDDRLKTESLYRYREQAEVLHTRLNSYIQLVNTSPEHANDKTDPFIINACLHTQMEKLYREENRLHDSMLNLQSEYSIFERKIIENTRNVLRTLEEYRTQDNTITDHTVHMIMETFNKLDADCEYKVFSERRQGDLVPQNATYRDLNDISYADQHHPLVIPVKIGYLERKTFVTKNWAEHKYALTPTGFLHEYKSEKDFPCNAEVSIFIPQTTVVEKNTNMSHDYIFEIRGRNNSKGKFMKTLEREKTYMFRTRTAEEMQVWMDLLTPMSHQFRPSVPHDPEPHMQPINTNYDEVISHSSTWGSSVAETDLHQRNASVANNEQPTGVGIEQPELDCVNTKQAVEETEAGVSDISLEPDKIQEAPQARESDKTEAYDEHNPFSDPTHTTVEEPSTKEILAEGQDVPNPTKARIPVTLYDQSESTPTTQIQENQHMPGSFML